MSKNNNAEGGSDSSNMLGEKTGSMLDIKTHEDFNNEHPNQIDPNLNKLKKKSDSKINEVNKKSKDQNTNSRK